MKNKKKSRIDTYYCEVYDIYLVVANRYATLEELQRAFTYSDDTPLDSRVTDCLATTTGCRRIKDKAYCILVKDNKSGSCTSRDKHLDYINTISHEATHVALDIYEAMSQNICYCTPEPFCYLQAWAMERIYKTLFNK